mgnify:FL=1
MSPATCVYDPCVARHVLKQMGCCAEGHNDSLRALCVSLGIDALGGQEDELKERILAHAARHSTDARVLRRFGCAWRRTR